MAFTNRIHTLKGDNRGSVFLDNQRLTPERSQKHHNHSPDGFNWGYPGSGPAQLALAVMLELYNSATGYQQFKWKYIAPLKMGEAFSIMFSDADLYPITHPEKENSIGKSNSIPATAKSRRSNPTR